MESVIDAVHAGLDAIRPGVTVASVYGAVREVLAMRSMLPDAVPERAASGNYGSVVNALTTSFPAHGHSFGMGWEPPWLVDGSAEVIRSNMCFGIEAMAGQPGIGSAKFEQDVLITEAGTELLNRIPTHYW
jgi:Xaa-Pro aminopeptidase